ncbi:MAG: YjfB family protein [Lachnospiraceae bacterium]|nr:YjfB family protein [Lachnospiraceae bacterium]
MDIPALSMAMSQMNVMNQFSTAMLSKALETYGETGDDMVKMMEQSVNPELGANIDVSV